MWAYLLVFLLVLDGFVYAGGAVAVSSGQWKGVLFLMVGYTVVVVSFVVVSGTIQMVAGQEYKYRLRR